MYVPSCTMPECVRCEECVLLLLNLQYVFDILGHYFEQLMWVLCIVGIEYGVSAVVYKSI